MPDLHPDADTARCFRCGKPSPTFGPLAPGEVWVCFGCYASSPHISVLRSNAEVREILLARMRAETKAPEEAVA